MKSVLRSRVSLCLVLFYLVTTSRLSAELQPDPHLVRSFPGLEFFRGVYHSPEDAKPLIAAGQAILEEDPVPILETRFNGKEMCRISFSWGPSEDPAFEFEMQNASGEWVHVGLIPALAIVVPGNGYIYSAGHTNNMFDARHKFALDKAEGSLKEVVQPFYRVDVETKVLQPIELRSESGKGAGEVIARLPKGSSVHVLVNRGNDYLVSTPFGLTGWLYLEEALRHASSLEDVWYAGD